MQKTSLLKECIRGFLTEAQGEEVTVFNHPQQAFELIDPVRVVPNKGGSDEYYISREFQLKMGPELMQVFELTPEEVAEYSQAGGVVDGEYEMFIDIDVYYTPGERSRSRLQPDDPEEFIIENYVVKGFYTRKGKVLLSKEDGTRLAEFLGEITDAETDRIREQYMENLPEPDYEPDYGPDSY